MSLTLSHHLRVELHRLQLALNLRDGPQRLDFVLAVPEESSTFILYGP